MEKFKLPNIEEEKSISKSFRIKSPILKKVEKLSEKTNISVNRLINELLAFALDNVDENSIKTSDK